MFSPREVAKKILPEDALNWYRRRHVRRLYLDALSRELLARQTQLDDIEGRMAAKRDGFSERLVKDVVERTEIILQELDRRIEAIQARTGQRLEELRSELVELRSELDRLRRSGPESNGDSASGGSSPIDEPAGASPSAD